MTQDSKSSKIDSEERCRPACKETLLADLRSANCNVSWTGIDGLMPMAADEIERLTEELESHAWEISPAMAQARLDNQAAEIATLQRELESAKQGASRAAARADRIRESWKQLHGCLVRVVTEGRGAGPDCSKEFLRMGLDSMIKIANDTLQRERLPVEERSESTFDRKCDRCGKIGKATRTDGVFYCSFECAD